MPPETGNLSSMCAKGFRANRSRDSANRRVQVVVAEIRKMKATGLFTNVVRIMMVVAIFAIAAIAFFLRDKRFLIGAI